MYRRVNKLHVFSLKKQSDITIVSNLSHSYSSSVHWIASYNSMHSVKHMCTNVYMCVQKKGWGEVTWSNMRKHCQKLHKLATFGDNLNLLFLFYVYVYFTVVNFSDTHIQFCDLCEVMAHSLRILPLKHTTLEE